MAEVAILGTGRMGAAMARRVALAGHGLTVWNRTQAAARSVVDALPLGTATISATPAEAVRGRGVVLSVLASGDATRTVLLDTAVLEALGPGSVVCDLATSGVATAHALESGLTGAGSMFVDAPVSGSVPAVEAGTLLVMASGAQDAIDAALPVLESFARRVLRVGEAGAGQAMKLAVNLVVHTLNAALSEALILADGAGITRESAYDVLQDSVIGAPFVQYKRAAFLDPSTPVAMSVALMLKDLQLITALADELAVGSPVTDAVLRAVEAACAAGLGAEDMASMSRFVAP